MTDYEAMYWQLRSELNIHESHSHEQALKYIAIHNDRYVVSQKVIDEMRVFANKLAELEKRTW